MCSHQQSYIVFHFWAQLSEIFFYISCQQPNGIFVHSTLQSLTIFFHREVASSVQKLCSNRIALWKLQLFSLSSAVNINYSILVVEDLMNSEDPIKSEILICSNKRVIQGWKGKKKALWRFLSTSNTVINGIEYAPIYRSCNFGRIKW